MIKIYYRGKSTYIIRLTEKELYFILKKITRVYSIFVSFIGPDMDGYMDQIYYNIYIINNTRVYGYWDTYEIKD